VVLWRQQADFATKYMTMGRLAYIEGRQQSRTCEAADGTKCRPVGVVAGSEQRQRVADRAAQVARIRMLGESNPRTHAETKGEGPAGTRKLARGGGRDSATTRRVRSALSVSVEFRPPGASPGRQSPEPSSVRRRSSFVNVRTSAVPRLLADGWGRART
jgi:single-stranded DNA-binding protein